MSLSSSVGPSAAAGAVGLLLLVVSLSSSVGPSAAAGVVGLLLLVVSLSLSVGPSAAAGVVGLLLLVVFVLVCWPVRCCWCGWVVSVGRGFKVDLGRAWCLFAGFQVAGLGLSSEHS